MCDAWYTCLAFGTHVFVPDGPVHCVRCVRRYTFMRSGMDKSVNHIQALYRSWKFSLLRCYTVFLKMKIRWSFRTLRTVHWTLQYHIPDHWNLHWKNAKFLHLYGTFQTFVFVKNIRFCHNLWIGKKIKIQIRCCFPAGQNVPYECSDSHILVSWHAVVEGSCTPYVCWTWV